jgi:hypothetical protein
MSIQNKRECIDCGKKYSPTGLRQRRCKKCSVLRRKQKRQVYNKKYYELKRENNLIS